MLVRLSLSLLLAWFWGVREAAAMTACSSGTAAVKYFSLDITSGYAAPDGFARAVYLVNGQSPGPLLNATQGETFAVNVVNRLPIEIGMHWHGLHQEGTPEYDGVPGVNQYAIPPGANVTYCFGTETNYGTYWYHIHLRDIYQDGVRGPILIQPNSSVARPYNKISTVQDDVNAMLQAEQAPVVLMVNDWFHQTSTEIGLRLAVTNDSMRPLCANSILFNGMGSVQCPPSTPGLSSFGCADMSSMGGMEPGNDMKSMSMMPMSMGSSTPMDSSLPMNSSIPGSKSVETSMSTKSSKPNSATSAAGSITMPMGGGTHLSAQSSAMASMSHMTGMATATGPSAQSAMPTTSPSMASLTDSTGTAAMSMAPASAFEIDPADEVCRNTSASRYVVSPPSSNTGDWLMLHLINAGASQQLAFSIDEHDLWVFSADGAFVLPQKVQVVNIGIGQRYGIMIRKPAQPRMQYTIRASTMTHQTYQGTAVLSYGMPNMDQSQSRPWIALDGSPLNSSVRGLEESALQPFPLEEVPKATKEIRLMVNQSQPTVWVLEAGHPFGSNNGQQTPLLFAPRNASGVFWLRREKSWISSFRFPAIVSTTWRIQFTSTAIISAFSGVLPIPNSPQT